MSVMPAAAPPPIGTRLFAPRDTLLAPAMLAARGRGTLPYVLNHPAVRYHYLGRNASYALTRGLGLTEGAELLFPSFFGPPVLQAPIEAGASVRFYPVHSGLRVDAADIRAAITPRTRAIYLIHFNGFPGPIADVMEIAREHDLIVLEDAAHAMLTTIDGRPAGSFGDGAIYSFYKWAPVPNGAALITNGPTIRPIPEAKHRSITSGVALSAFSLLDYADHNWGKPGALLKGSLRGVGKQLSRRTSLAYVSTGGVQFNHDELDIAMSAISHRILRVQDWEKIGRLRRRNYLHLADLLADSAPPLQGDLPTGVTPLFYATAVENKRAVLTRLAARGIQGRNFWELHHDALPAGTWSETDELRRTTLELPIHQDLDRHDMERIAAAVRAVLPVRGRIS